MIKIEKPDKPIRVSVPLTPSKSITNRLLIIQALSQNELKIQNPSMCDDCNLLSGLLCDLSGELNIQDSGTGFRFLTAYLSTVPGEYLLTGTSRMKSRPVGKLVNALKDLGADINYIEKVGFPPLKISGKKIRGGKVKIDASESSQYVSSLLLIAPYLEDGLNIVFTETTASRSYIHMTLSLMQQLGIKLEIDENQVIIPPQYFAAGNITVENDWSAASFWYVITALAKNAEVSINNLQKNSIQGDKVIDSIMNQFGVFSESSNSNLLLRKSYDFVMPQEFSYDFSDNPDLVIPVAIVCAALKINSEFRGVKNLRIKESDRLLALKQELAKTGARMHLEEDSFRLVDFSERDELEILNSHHDHRIVMALSALSLMFGEVYIDNHQPVSKSYPEFWNHLQLADFTLKVS